MWWEWKACHNDNNDHFHQYPNNHHDLYHHNRDKYCNHYNYQSLRCRRLYFYTFFDEHDGHGCGTCASFDFIFVFPKSALLISVNFFECTSLVFDFASAELVAFSAAALSKCLAFCLPWLKLRGYQCFALFCSLVVSSVSSNLHTLDSFDLDFGTLQIRIQRNKSEVLLM